VVRVSFETMPRTGIKTVSAFDPHFSRGKITYFKSTTCLGEPMAFRKALLRRS